MSDYTYIVATASDEYDDEALLPDVLRTEVDLPSLNSHDYSRTRAFRSLEAAQRYYQSFNGIPAFSDGSGNLRDRMSIFKVENASEK